MAVTQQKNTNIEIQDSGTGRVESTLVDIIGFPSIIVLLGTVSYVRFVIYHGLYYPLFRLAWDRSLFPGDMIQGSFFMDAAIAFYAILAFMAPLAKYFGEEHFLFIIYMFNNM